MPFLSLLFSKDAMYIGIIMAVVAGFGWYTIHERDIGKREVAAVQAKFAAAQKARVEKVEVKAHVNVTKSLAAYGAALRMPTLPAPVLVCHTSGGHTHGVRGYATAASSGHGPSTGAEKAGQGFNPVPKVLSTGRAADAQIALLQAYIRACQNAGACKVK